MNPIKSILPAPEGYFEYIISKIFPSPVKSITCSPLRGDASDRNYFRLTFDASENNISSIVLMQLTSPPLLTDNPFITTQAFMTECGVKTPKIYYKDNDKGFIFLEYLGDITLEKKLMTSSIEEQEKYYKKAIDILIDVQTECTKHIHKDIPAYHLAFDLEKLTWELDFMTKHFLEGFLHQPISENNKKTLNEDFFKICSFLANQKRYFCHRDYHSRNIMINKNELILIDFQDARMGPCQYDLASLLRDSYFKLNHALIDKLLNYFLRKKKEKEKTQINKEEFLKAFDWMCIQRNLKALGTFGYQVSVKKNERYKESIPRTIEYVFENLDKYNELQGLKECLEIMYNSGE